MVTFWLGLGTNITLIFRERLWFGLKEGLKVSETLWYG